MYRGQRYYCTGVIEGKAIIVQAYIEWRGSWPCAVIIAVIGRLTPARRGLSQHGLDPEGRFDLIVSMSAWATCGTETLHRSLADHHHLSIGPLAPLARRMAERYKRFALTQL